MSDQHDSSTSTQSLYERLGGQPAMKAAVERFYDKLLADERVRSFFDDVDMKRQLLKQRAFLTVVTGGPNAYEGQDMRRAHAHLVERGLNDTHVDVVITTLGETLSELGVGPNEIAEVAAIANSVRDDVLSR